VEYDLWTVPKQYGSERFLLNFKKAAVALGDHAFFTPHQYIVDGVELQCVGNAGENFCYNDCTNNGRYCAFNEKNISGADMIRESLRRLCIWDVYGASDKIGTVWWDYIAEFIARCDGPDYFSNDDCINDAYKHSGVQADLIQRCMIDSGGLDAVSTNVKLSQRSFRTHNEVLWLCSAFVNNAAFREHMSASNVFGAICLAFAEGTMPEICQKCVKCHDALVVSIRDIAVLMPAPWRPPAVEESPRTPLHFPCLLSLPSFLVWRSGNTNEQGEKKCAIK